MNISELKKHSEMKKSSVTGLQFSKIERYLFNLKVKSNKTLKHTLRKICRNVQE